MGVAYTHRDGRNISDAAEFRTNLGVPNIAGDTFTGPVEFNDSVETHDVFHAHGVGDAIHISQDSGIAWGGAGAGSGYITMPDEGPIKWGDTITLVYEFLPTPALAVKTGDETDYSWMRMKSVLIFAGLSDTWATIDIASYTQGEGYINFQRVAAPAYSDIFIKQVTGICLGGNKKLLWGADHASSGYDWGFERTGTNAGKVNDGSTGYGDLSMRALTTTGLGTIAYEKITAPTAQTRSLYSGSTASANIGLLVQDSTIANYPGTASVVHYGMWSTPQVEVTSGVGTSPITVGGLYCAPLFTTSQTTTRISMTGYGADALRGSANDVSTNANNSLIGCLLTHGHSNPLATTAVTGASTGLQISGSLTRGTINTYTGIKVQTTATPATGIAVSSTTAYGFLFDTSNIGTGAGTVAITDFYALRLRALNVGANGTITNRYGISQEDAAATNVFAGPSQFTNLVKLSPYTVATLPTPTAAGQFVFATDGRNSGEGAAAGTGCPVRSTAAAGTWKTLYDNSTVAA